VPLESISVSLSSFSGEGTYTLGTGTESRGNYAEFIGGDVVARAASTRMKDAGQIHVASFDSTSGRIRGTFHFDARTETGETLRVRNAQFQATLRRLAP
jgi:uncharacterized cupin superfamily protein